MCIRNVCVEKQSKIKETPTTTTATPTATAPAIVAICYGHCISWCWFCSTQCRQMNNVKCYYLVLYNCAGRCVPVVLCLLLFFFVDVAVVVAFLLFHFHSPLFLRSF